MAPRPELDAGPKPITPGPQMQALARFWRPVIEYAHVPAERFPDFGEPGYAKTERAHTAAQEQAG